MNEPYVTLNNIIPNRDVRYTTRPRRLIVLAIA